MGQLEAMHRKVFYAIHNDRQKLDKPADIAAFMSKNGVDGAKVVELMGSFAVQTKARQARQLAEAYKIDGVPALGIQGRFYTSGSLAGGQDKMLVVADFLIQASRKV
jgi:thiol:disulfide interchange protein DsbA